MANSIIRRFWWRTNKYLDLSSEPQTSQNRPDRSGTRQGSGDGLRGRRRAQSGSDGGGGSASALSEYNPSDHGGIVEDLAVVFLGLDPELLEEIDAFVAIDPFIFSIGLEVDHLLDPRGVNDARTGEAWR